MKKFVTGLIIVLVIIIVSIVLRTYESSSMYNYATAKMDIIKGNINVIHAGTPRTSSKDKEIEKVAARYGFKNIFIEISTYKKNEKGIKDYNDVIEIYLNLHNGPGWKVNYKREVDSLYKS